MLIHGSGQHRAFGLATFAVAFFGALLATPLFKVQDVACTFLAQHDLKAKELQTWGLPLQTPSILASYWRDLMSHPVRNETDAPVCLIQKPSRFDCNLSTEDYHRSNQERLYGRYASIRGQLDYDYHAHYSRSRQMFQDSIIDSMLENTWIEDKYGQNCSQPTRPWIVFTAGVMGAGYVFVNGSNLSRQQHCRRVIFVHFAALTPSFCFDCCISNCTERRTLSRNWTALASSPSILSYQSIQMIYGTLFCPNLTGTSNSARNSRGNAPARKRA